MGTFEVDADRVASAAGAVSTSSANISNEVDQMMRNLTALQDSWRGSAAQSFQQVITEWRGVQERVRESLTNINEALTVAGQQYAEVEMSNTRLFAG
ncbi:WXG100 family type VII secretion target [Saxibacter everestensis]|uniref:ESAT-6-like protein n=1 Tax=Saxibacter everestensis TaxID=2909229 RepID=A0ABY8QW33_9MICO|nr:WXG100 family type VII secretion target [Brevibacteriaceae bacterium ZFBP1038]